MSLTDPQQSVLMLVSGILIAVGAVAVPEGLPLGVGLALGIAGAIGFAIKEALGSAPATTTA